LKSDLLQKAIDLVSVQGQLDDAVKSF